MDVEDHIQDLCVFADVLDVYAGRITLANSNTVLIAAASEFDLEKITTAVTLAIKAGRCRGALGDAPIFLCEPPSGNMVGTYIDTRVWNADDTCRPTVSSFTDEHTDILSLVDTPPERREYTSRLHSSLFYRIRSLQYIRKRIVLRLHFGLAMIGPPPTTSTVSWPTLADYLDSSATRYTMKR